MTRSHNRGVSAVVGLTLLIGIVAIGSVTVLVIGDNIQQSSEERIDDTRIESSFVQLKHEVATVSKGKTTQATVDFDLANSATSDAAIRREATGEIVIERTNLTDAEQVARTDIGSIIYTRGDTRYTYQAGAVWRNTGNATQLVSAPQISYEFSARDGRARPTLSLDIPELNGSDRVGSGEVSIAHNRTIAPFNNVSTVDNELITMSVTSEFYVGWGEYFEDRYPEVSTVSYDHPNDTVTIKFGKQEIDGEFKKGIVSEGDVDINNPSVTLETTIGAGASVSDPSQVDCSAGSGSDCIEDGLGSSGLATLDNVVRQRASELSDECAGGSSSDPDINCYSTLAGNSLSGGNTYYVSGDSQINSNDVTVDLSGGNVTVVSDGNIGLKGNAIKTKDGDQPGNCCYLRVYMNGTDMAMANQGSLETNDGGSPGNATRFQVYGTSDFHLDAKNVQATGGGGATGEGPEAAIYAPGASGSDNQNDAIPLVGSLNNRVCDDADTDVCLGQGSGEWHGAIIAGSVSFDQNAEIDFDKDLKKISPKLAYTGTVPPPITFLQVSVHEICVGEDRPTC